jgi:hypothetical protein
LSPATNPELELDDQPLSGKLTPAFDAGASVEFRIPAGGTTKVLLHGGEKIRKLNCVTTDN